MKGGLNMRVIEFSVPNEIIDAERAFGVNRSLYPVKCIVRNSKDTSRSFVLFAYSKADIEEQLIRYYPTYSQADIEEQLNINTKAD